MRIHRPYGDKRPAPLVKILLAFAVIVGISFCLAWVWQSTEQSDAGHPPATQESDRVEPHTEGAVPVTETQESSSNSATSIEESLPAEEQTPEEAAPVIDGAVPLSDAVGTDYFDDAIFIGDSISTGIPLYHLADNAAVVAMTGISPANILTKKSIDIGGEERVTILEAAATYGKRGKVYIMLGGNGMGYDKQTFIADYKDFLTAVKLQYPDAIIYLQSITPVVEGYVNEFDPTLDNAKIDEYNLEILALAGREGVYYLDVASVMKNEQGALPDEASPYDGMHFTPEYYYKWFDYLGTHTVQQNGKA